MSREPGPRAGDKGDAPVARLVHAAPFLIVSVLLHGVVGFLFLGEPPASPRAAPPPSGVEVDVVWREGGVPGGGAVPPGAQGVNRGNTPGSGEAAAAAHSPDAVPVPAVPGLDVGARAKHEPAPTLAAQQKDSPPTVPTPDADAQTKDTPPVVSTSASDAQREDTSPAEPAPDLEPRKKGTPSVVSPPDVQATHAHGAEPSRATSAQAQGTEVAMASTAPGGWEAGGGGEALTPMGTGSPGPGGAGTGIGAARSGGAPGAGGGVDLGAYGARLSTRITGLRRYPAAAVRFRMEGTAVVQVWVGRDGRLAAPPRLVTSSGHGVLDAEALRMVKAAEPFAPLPDGHEGPSAEFVVPVRFFLNTPG
ncbi:TonB family protein [Myxococcaceae bacterium GXIMD 01537]